jgi:hypothetical protein
MGLHKGCKPNNPQGRVIGSKNVATTNLKIWVKTLLETNTELFEKDLMAIVEPKDRLQVMTQLLKYAIPTLSSVSVEAQIQEEYSQIKELLDAASPEAIEAISKKIIELNSLTKK